MPAGSNMARSQRSGLESVRHFEGKKAEVLRMKLTEAQPETTRHLSQQADAHSSCLPDKLFKRILSHLAVRLPNESFHVFATFADPADALDQQAARNALCQLMLVNNHFHTLARPYLWSRIVPIQHQYTETLVDIFGQIPKHRMRANMECIRRLFLALCPEFALNDCMHRRLVSACVNLTHLSLLFCGPLEEEAYEWDCIVSHMPNVHTIALDFHHVDPDPLSYDGDRATAIIAGCLVLEKLRSFRINNLFNLSKYEYFLPPHPSLSTMVLVDLPPTATKDVSRLLSVLSARFLDELVFIDCKLEPVQGYPLAFNSKVLSFHLLKQHDPLGPRSDFSWLSSMESMSTTGYSLTLAYLSDICQIEAFPRGLHHLTLVDVEVQVIIECFNIICKTFPQRNSELPVLEVQGFYLALHSTGDYTRIFEQLGYLRTLVTENVLDDRILLEPQGLDRTIWRRCEDAHRKQKFAFQRGLEELHRQFEDEWDNW